MYGTGMYSIEPPPRRAEGLAHASALKFWLRLCLESKTPLKRLISLRMRRFQADRAASPSFPPFAGANTFPDVQTGLAVSPEKYDRCTLCDREKSHNMLAGYSGYTPGFRTVAPTLAPGTENNTRKFQSAGKSVVYPDQPISRLMNQPRLSVSSDSGVPPPRAYKVPDARGVMGAKLDKQKERLRRRADSCTGPRKRWNSPTFTRRSGRPCA